LYRSGKLVWPICWCVFVLVAAWVFKPENYNRNYWVFISILFTVASWIFYYLIKSFLNRWLNRFSSQEIIIRLTAFLSGLGVAALLLAVSDPLMESFDLIRRSVLILTILFLCSSLFMFMAYTKTKELTELFFNSNQCAEPKKISAGKDLLKILDTSAIIDGRIADLCKTGFLEGVLIIPHFILNELQKIADSSDPLRRNRGRRGLDILNKIQKENQVSVRIFDLDYEDLAEVDTKLLRLARELEAKVVTNDFNLNKVAELYGVEVLNINDLSNAIKPVVLPGEEMMVHVLRDGKEYGQGIGYLEDGTMIVVEGGKNFIGLNTEIIVTSVLQTSAGRMIFAKPKDYAVSKVTSM
jgi:uncharacterized protein YacL